MTRPDESPSLSPSALSAPAVASGPAVIERPTEGQDESVFARLRGLPQLLLTSGQTLPNLLSLHELAASGYVLLTTPQEPPARLRAICKAFGYEELADPIQIDALDDRITERAVREGFRRLVAARPELAWVLNTTGGTKLACLGAARALGSPDHNEPGLVATVYYERGLRCAVPGWSRSAHRPIQRPLGVADLLRANGILAQREAPVPLDGMPFTFSLGTAPTREDRAAARAIAADRNRMLVIGSKRQGDTLPHQAVGALVERYVRGPQGAGYLSRPSLFFNGLWLECFLYDLLDRHRASGALPIDDIQMGVKLQRTMQHGQPETDLDVCVASQNILSFVSCKTGAIDDLPDEVFEVSARRNGVGGTFGGGALLHGHDTRLLGADKKKVLSRADKTAASLRVSLLHGDLLIDEEALLEGLRGVWRR